MILLRTGVLPTDRTPTAHFWYHDESGASLRLCDGDSDSETPEPAHATHPCALCDTCKYMFADDVSYGRNQFVIDVI